MTLVSPTTSKSWKTTEDRSENYFQVRKNSFTTSAPGKQHSGGQCQSLKSSNTFVNRNTAILQQGKKHCLHSIIKKTQIRRCQKTSKRVCTVLENNLFEAHKMGDFVQKWL